MDIRLTHLLNLRFAISLSALNPAVVYTTDRSSYFVWLYVFYHGAFHVESCLVLCSRVVSVWFSMLITSLGEKRAGLNASRALVC